MVREGVSYMEEIVSDKLSMHLVHFIVQRRDVSSVEILCFSIILRLRVNEFWNHIFFHEIESNASSVHVFSGW